MPRVAAEDEVPFAQRIQLLMRQKELTLEELAEKASIPLTCLWLAISLDSPKALRKRERDRLANVLGVTEEYLLRKA